MLHDCTAKAPCNCKARVAKARVAGSRKCQCHKGSVVDDVVGEPGRCEFDYDLEDGPLRKVSRTVVGRRGTGIIWLAAPRGLTE